MQTSIIHAGNAKYKHLFKRDVELKEHTEFDLENLGESLIEGFKEIIAYKQGKIDLPDAEEYSDKIKEMRKAKNDRCFIDDILEIAEDFKAVDYKDMIL
jgi:hypothetical protein